MSHSMYVTCSEDVGKINVHVLGLTHVPPFSHHPQQIRVQNFPIVFIKVLFSVQ